MNALHPSISRSDPPPPTPHFPLPVSPSFHIRARRAGTVFWARGVFPCSRTVDLRPSLGDGTLPCNLRSYPEHDGRAIVPDLSGAVAVLDANNSVISVVNVSGLLAEWSHDHPHDAIFLPSGDMVVATWNPGRLSYWRKL